MTATRFAICNSGSRGRGCETLADRGGAAGFSDHRTGSVGSASAGETWQDARALYIKGDFTAGGGFGGRLETADGYALAARATSLQASRLSKERQEAGYKSAERVECIAADAQNPEGYFELARAVGQLGELRGVLAALTQGVTTQVKDNLERALKLRPSHSEAMMGLGVWQAQVSPRGGLLAASFGAHLERAEPLILEALKLRPNSIGFLLEYAKTLNLMDAKRNRGRALEQLQTALNLEPADAEERLYWKRAKLELERLRS